MYPFFRNCYVSLQHLSTQCITSNSTPPYMSFKVYICIYTLYVFLCRLNLIISTYIISEAIQRVFMHTQMYVFYRFTCPGRHIFYMYTGLMSSMQGGEEPLEAARLPSPVVFHRWAVGCSTLPSPTF